MKILFLDQSGKIGGAELCLLDLAKYYSDRCLVALFEDGLFRQRLEQHQIHVQVLTSIGIKVRKDSSFLSSLGSLSTLIPLIIRVTQIARSYELIYANTQKALVVGALASFLSRRPLVYHLHDILSPEHFSQTNRRLAVTLANHFASLVIANSQATQAAFIEAGGRGDKTTVVYNGFEPEKYQASETAIAILRQQLRLEKQFVVGHFSRLSPWKGQHILLEALAKCPRDVTAIFVGDALFGEQDYVEYLSNQVEALGLKNRVQFLGFQSDVVPLMYACDLIVHTSTLPEPFGRVIVEAMLCGRPVVGTGEGGVTELIEIEKTGWMISPSRSQHLAEIIVAVKEQPDKAKQITHQAQIMARQNFDLKVINEQIARLLSQVVEQRVISLGD